MNNPPPIDPPTARPTRFRWECFLRLEFEAPLFPAVGVIDVVDVGFGVVLEEASGVLAVRVKKGTAGPR